MMQNTNDILIRKLDQFIRRYYQNQLIKGILYCLLFMLSGFLIINTLEYFGYYNQLTRGILFWGCISLTVLTVIRYIGIPLIKIAKLGKTITYQQAAIIIGDHFPDVQDKLLNLLQLKADVTDNQSELLEASIQQKTDQLSPIPFGKAIDLKKNRKYVKYIFIPITIILLALIIYPSFIIEPSRRIVNYNTFYEKPAPFSFEIQNSNLQVPQQENYVLTVKVIGKMIPDEVYLMANGVQSKMKKDNKLLFTYEFKNVNQNIVFSFIAGKYTSSEYVLTVLPKPVIIDYTVKIHNPLYTNKGVETYENTGDVTVIQGAMVEWVFQTKDAAYLSFWFDSVVQKLSIDSTRQLSISKKLIQPVTYGFYVGNQYIPSTDSLHYSIMVIEDEKPSISVIEYKDTLVTETIFFKGEIKDDYGFTKLLLKIERKNKEKGIDQYIEEEVPFKKSEVAQEFDYFFDLSTIDLSSSDEINYYFEVWDNDGFSGPKSSVSQKFYYKVLSLDDIDKLAEKTITEVKEETDKSLTEIKKAQQDIKELMKKLVEKKELNWQDQKQIQELAEKQKNIKESLKEIQEKIKQNHLLEEHYKQMDESIIEKQKQLEKLFEKLINDELKEMMNEIEKMLNSVEKDQIKSALDKIKMNNESIEKQLDRNIELLKKLEIEKELNEVIQKVSELSEKQLELYEDTKKTKKDDLKAIEDKQKQLSDDFQKIKSQLNEIEKKSNDLQESKPIKRNQGLENEVQDKQNEANEQLQKKDKNNAAKMQKEAGDAAKKLADELEKMKDEMEMDELGEDIDKIRLLLKNLITLSFNQESLIEKLKVTYIQDPNYQVIINSQNKIKDDFKMIEDSLSSIAKRQMKVSSVINKEVSTINMNLAQSMDNLLKLNQSFYGQNKNPYAATFMQYTMTSLNNLALILAESLDNMQNQARSNKQKSSSSNKNCSNPSSGGGKKKSKSVREMQEQLSESLKKMKESLEKEKNQGKSRKVGEGNEMNQELARMAAQQEYLRKLMQEYSEELKSKSGGKQNKEIDALLREMEQNETDIVNKTITQQTIQRQQQIITRLLEHEKADLKREQEERRESNEAKDIYKRAVLDSLYNYKKKQIGNQEMLKWETPVFSPFYKRKINDYFYHFDNSK